MRTRWDLTTAAGSRWTLTGWRQNDWEFADNFVRVDGRADVPGVPAQVPGSVRGALVAAGIAPAPWPAEHSRNSEWIENRHWTFDTVLDDALLDGTLSDGAVSDGTAAGGPDADASGPCDPARSRLVLTAESLDFSGVVQLGGQTIAPFRGSARRVEFDITEAYRAGNRNLRIVFTQLPDDLGQIGRTSLIRDWKSRFAYGWDWTPRIVQVGIAGPIALELRSGTVLVDPLVTAELPGGPGSDGQLTIVAAVTAAASPAPASAGGGGVEGDVGALEAVVTVTGDDGFRWETTHLLDGARRTYAVPGVAAWCDHSTGEQPLYQVTITLPDGETHSRTVGFRSIRWDACDGAPAGADPWICVVNGTPVFLAGVNWVPIRPDSADVTPDDYRSRLLTYRSLGINTLRVWGGAVLEQQVFYDLADELGFLVWQELPLSSSGLDNTPPDDPALVAEFAAIADDYIARIVHHPSVILWGGGNELTEPIPGDGSIPAPLGLDHPMLAAAGARFAALDPGRRYVATSPTGPRVWGNADEFGTGVHWDVHGPWETDLTTEQWNAYWDNDDALIRSEVGMGGASDLAVLEEFDLAVPTDTPQEVAALLRLWSHSSSWWLGPVRTWDFSDGGLPRFVEYSQQRQAELLGYAASVTRARFPRCGGFIVWLGHDTFPCAVSLSVLDFHGTPKPVAAALAAAFRAS